jgi:undecaprenyl-diphosphatase
MNLADAISISLVATYIIPLILTYYDPDYFIVFVAVIFTWLSVEAIKPLFHSPRPPHAIRCDRWCVGGPVGGTPGFPSGHMASVAVLMTLLYWILPNLSKYILFGGLLWILLMGWSRLEKKCHTLTQVVGGTAYGILVAIGVRQIS